MAAFLSSSEIGALHLIQTLNDKDVLFPQLGHTTSLGKHFSQVKLEQPP